jgi:hypothetical protein
MLISACAGSPKSGHMVKLVVILFKAVALVVFGSSTVIDLMVIIIL